MAEKGRHSIPRWRRWLYRLLLVTGATVVPLLGLEWVLRLVDFGHPTTALVPCEMMGQESYCSNPRFGDRFFPPPLAKQFVPFSFPADKPAGTYRIFVLGGSAAQGTPDPSLSFARILQVMLRERHPGTKFEVVNLAIMGVNSHVVRVIARDCARVPGDLFLVYLGNNEVVGPYGPGTATTSLFGSSSWVRAHVALKGTRTGQLLDRLIDAVGMGAELPGDARGLEEFLHRNPVRADDPRLEIVRESFRSNLEDIVEAANDGGYGVILSTVGCNLKDHAPFSSLHRTNLSETDRGSWEQIYRRGVALERDGRHREAMVLYREAASIDPTFADLQFRLGRCCTAESRWQEALEHFSKARDSSTLRFRPDAGINAIIRAVAEEQASRGVVLVDGEEILRRNSPHGIPGDELFYDHVHLTFEGNYLLASAFLESIEGILPQEVTAAGPADSLRGPPSLSECAAALAFTEWDRARLRRTMLDGFFKRALFPGQLDHERRVRRLEDELRALEADLTYPVLEAIAGRYREAIARNPRDRMISDRYADVLRDVWRARRRQGAE